MKSEFKSERGSYTIEASISLVIFVMAIMLIYSQIKVLIGECIIQNAVNNMARETASYVYILDRIGLVVKHKDGETENIDNIISESGKITGEFDDLLENLFPDESNGGSKINVEGIEGNAQSMIDSIKVIYSELGSVTKDQLTAAGVSGAEGVIKVAANSILSSFYKWKLNAYIPMEYERFCRYFMIDDKSIKFTLSRVFPDEKNNSVLVVVEYDTSSMFRFLPMKRHVVKYAYTAAWVSSNANN